MTRVCQEIYLAIVILICTVTVCTEFLMCDNRTRLVRRIKVLHLCLSIVAKVTALHPISSTKRSGSARLIVVVCQKVVEPSRVQHAGIIYVVTGRKVSDIILVVHLHVYAVLVVFLDIWVCAKGTEACSIGTYNCAASVANLYLTVSVRTSVEDGPISPRVQDGDKVQNLSVIRVIKI